MTQKYYNRQIERYLSQIIRSFSGFTVTDGVQRDGEFRTENVPVIFGTPSRVIAAINSGDQKFRNVRIPLMAVNMTGIELDEEGNLNRYHENQVAYRDRETGNFTATRRMVGPSLRLNISLHVFASSMTQLMTIIERLLLRFNPELIIQKSTDVNDMDYISSIRLEGIDSSIQAPLGQNSRTVEMTLQFSSPIRLSYPEKTEDALEQVILNVKNEDGSDDGADTIQLLDGLDEEA